MGLYYTVTENGIEVPSRTTVQRNAIVSPSNRLMIWNSDTNQFEVNIGTPGTPNWRGIGSYATGIISPPSFGVNQNNYNPTGLESADVIRITISAGSQITGLVAPSPVASVRKTIVNTSASNLTLTNNSASSTAANRFIANGNKILATDECVDILYDTTTARWRIIDN